MVNSQLEHRHAAVFGATGATGREITRELLRRGAAVRVVSRSIEKLKRDFGELDVELRVAGLLDREAAVAAAQGCDLIFHCVGVPLHRFDLHPHMTRNTAAAMRAHGARGVLVTSFWSYGPQGSTSVSEDRPPVDDCRKCRQRREQEEVMLEAGGAVAILPDFFGPGAEASMLNDALAAAAAGKRVLWPGDPDAPRDFIYIPDVGPVLCDLAWRRESFGERWNVPGSGVEMPRRLIEAVAQGEVEIQRARRWMLLLGGIFKRQLREFRDVLPLYEGSYGLDGSRLAKLLEGLEPTPYDEALPATVNWLSARGAL
jgi:nucleoside-diphosphate-sugar epimerase